MSEQRALALLREIRQFPNGLSCSQLAQIDELLTDRQGVPDGAPPQADPKRDSD